MSKSSANATTDTVATPASLQSQWEKCLRLIKEEISTQGFQTWIKPIIPVSFVDNKLILRVPSQFFFEWLESNFRKSIHRAVKNIFNRNSSVEFLVASTPEKTPEKINLSESESTEKKEPPQNSETQFQPDDRYLFENFLAADDNELALRAAQTVANKPGKTDYNPLLIHGNSGCGKTHLLHAIGNDITENRKRKKICCLSSETFLNEYIYALQNRKLDLFYKKFSRYDVFLLDDIQYLSNKKKSQEGLFFLLSELERKRKQIVVTSNRAPAQFIGFEANLLSFFQRGLIVDLVYPNRETRLRWIDSFCLNNHLTILPEVRDLLASNFSEGLVQLKALMVRISAHSSLLGEPVSLVKTKKLLSQIDTQWTKKNGNFRLIHPVKIEKIIQRVSEYMNVPLDLLLGYSRKRDISQSRQIAIYLCKELSGEPLKVIAYHFSNRHYTGILHNYRIVCNELKRNPILANLISDIKSELIK